MLVVACSEPSLMLSGIINKKCVSVIGNGVVVSLSGLLSEVEKNREKGPGLEGWERRLLISNRAHIVFDFHKLIDEQLEQERNKRLGTTKKGIGPAYAAKMGRVGLRIEDLLGDWDIFSDKVRLMAKGYMARFPDLVLHVEDELAKCKGYISIVRPMVRDTVVYLHKAIKEHKNIIVEGANATMLDIDFGTYPFVTSSNCTVGGVCTGLGIPPRDVTEVYGVMKAYSTRVGSGVMPTELLGEDEELGKRLREKGGEYGVTTGRPRRCGWFDAVVSRYSTMINGYTSICLTKLDILDDFDEVKVGVAYTIDGSPVEGMPAEHDLQRVVVQYEVLPGWKSKTAGLTSFSALPPNAQAYVHTISQLVQVPIQWVGTGPGREDIIAT
jgi:adenylosuccinate synthase